MTQQRRFTKEFREEAVRLAQTSGRTGPVAKLFRARFVRELRSAEPAFAQLKVEIWPSEI